MICSYSYETQFITRYLREGSIKEDSFRAPESNIFNHNTKINEDNLNISLRPLISAEEIFENIKEHISTYQFEDLVTTDYLVEEYEKIVRDFPESPEAPKALLETGHLYRDRAFRVVNGQETVIDPQDKQLAITQYEKVIKMFPESQEAKSARYLISSMKEYRESTSGKRLSERP